MPWMAFVPDMSGVCSVEGTLPISSMPEKHGEEQHIDRQ